MIRWSLTRLRAWKDLCNHGQNNDCARLTDISTPRKSKSLFVGCTDARLRYDIKHMLWKNGPTDYGGKMCFCEKHSYKNASTFNPSFILLYVLILHLLKFVYGQGKNSKMK